MMDSSSSFSAIITGGIQDISALLPLLGTEQCEKHVGSALDGGFLYSSVTPISIFGSLGIVRAAFNILIASVDIQQYRFLGARKLNNGGFDAGGVVAPMIALDTHNPKRFLAESRLEKMLFDEHIENAEDLKVTWGEGIAWWNFLLVILTLFIASAGLVPYVFVIRNGSEHNAIRPLFPLGLRFPILRVVGSVLCVNLVQFLIQIRVLVLLKTRLLFIAIDRLSKEANIDLDSEISSKTQRKKGKKWKKMWSSELASEKCIWALEKWLAAKSQTITAPEKENNIAATINEIYISQYKQQLESMQRAVPYWIKLILYVGLVAGILLTVIGYVGCFYLIQHSSGNTSGPLLWLILEALLSVIRILVWVFNPSWDDSKGIVFELQLASHAPLLTYNRYEGDIADDGVAPVARANSFLEEIVAYTGPLPLFSADDSTVALYYILIAKGKGPPHSASTLPPARKLYVVISDYKERTSRILFKQDDWSPFSIYMSELEHVPGTTTINIRSKFSKGAATEPKTHFLTADDSFMDKLMVHYDQIVAQLQKQELNVDRKAFFSKTWSLQRLAEEGEDCYSEDNTTLDSGLGSEGHLGLLTNEDMAYLRQGQVEKRWREMYSQLEEWIELYIALYTKELLEDVPVNPMFREHESVDIVQKYEANEVEYLIIECRTFLEQLLLSTAAKWDEFVEMNHKNMAYAVIQGTFLRDAAISLTEFSNSCKGQGSEMRKNKLESRLAEEWRVLLEKETQSHRDNMHSRLMVQADSTEKRIQKRKYNDPTGGAIVKIWRNLEDEIHLGLSGQSAAYTEGRASNSSEPASPDNTSPGDTRNSSHSFPPSSGKHSQDGKAAAIASNYAQKDTTAARRRDAYIAKMRMRFSEGDKDISNRTSEIDGTNKSRFELMKARCRQRVDQLFLRMENQMMEFKELDDNDILTADSHELVEFWRTESLRERQRLLDRMQKYLIISDDSIQAVGGQQNMTRALMRSQEYFFLDITESTLFTAEEAASIVNGLKSVTGVASSFGDEAGKKIWLAVEANLSSAVAAKEDVCFYWNAIVTDYYRRGHPYLLFLQKGRLSCIVFFHIHQKGDHIITLRHCVTTANAKVAISLNDHSLESTWGQSNLVKFDFANEDIHLPEAYLVDVGQRNTLTITLMEESEGGYWLSNVFLPPKPALSSAI